MRVLWHKTVRIGRPMTTWWELSLKWEPRDCWVGVYWKRYPAALEMYVCIVPLVPVYLYVQWFR